MGNQDSVLNMPWVRCLLEIKLDVVNTNIGFIRKIKASDVILGVIMIERLFKAWSG